MFIVVVTAVIFLSFRRLFLASHYSKSTGHCRHRQSDESQWRQVSVNVLFCTRSPHIPHTVLETKIWPLSTLLYEVNLINNNFIIVTFVTFNVSVRSVYSEEEKKMLH